MRDDFCVLILTHGRPDNMVTLRTLERYAYKGPVYLVIDDEDARGDEYRERYGEQVICFSKEEIAATIDEAGNFGDRRSILYARNACPEIARRLGFKYFIHLDDDYSEFKYRHGPWYVQVWRTLGDLWSAMVDFLEGCPPEVLTVAMSQGGDFIGGAPDTLRLRRKAMNSFICSVDRPFQFHGVMNEDVNTYVTLGRRGQMFFTAPQVQLDQAQTQGSAGGITELYLRFGTYAKSFYTVMHAPSCTKVGVLHDPRGEPRIHHSINWNRAVPLILREDQRKASKLERDDG